MKFVALLRGVNVGKGKRVPMADLRALLEGLGHTEVVTLLNSGNAVFRAAGGRSAALAGSISAAIAGRLKVEVPVIVKSARELSAIVDDCGLKVDEADHPKLLVAFAQSPRQLASLQSLAPLVAAREKFILGQQAAYLYCANGILQSKAGAALLGKAGREATTRNWATVLKLRQLVT